ncbi:MAG: hypothetical protein HGA98_01230 [Deltaproteobacteria bacterium]|nr:hypothetical protein [Deltaproteobacteria bacterium]
MDAHTAWDNLSDAIADLERSEGDYDLKLATVMAGVVLLFEHPAPEILANVERSALSTRALVSWLLYEGGRLPGVDPSAVESLRELYEATCPAGQGVIPPPPPEARVVPS